MILSSPHQNSSLPRISANIRGARTTKLIVAAIEAYRFGYRMSCQQVSSRNGQPDVEDHEVDVGEVGRRAVHVPGLGVLDRLRAERDALVHADQVDPEFLGFLED